MHKLQLPFKLLTVTGIWMPVYWVSWQKKFMWILFSVTCIIIISMAFGSLLIHFLGSKSFEQFSERIFLVPTGASLLQKIYIFIVHRKRLIALDDMLITDFCMPRNVKEINIQKKYDDFIRSLTVAWAILVNITVMHLVSLPLLTNQENQTLPLKGWLPFETKSDSLYWFAYAQQALGVLVTGASTIGATLMINGFLYQICAQFDILALRFQKLPTNIRRLLRLKKPHHFISDYEKRILKGNIQHHLHIFGLAKTVNDLFKSIIFQQFSLSFIVVSTSIYQLSTRPERNMEFLMVFFYLVCVLTEFLIYSWFGNELKLKSLNFLDSIYSIDWTLLSVNTRKDLVFIMLRTLHPITMSCGHFIVLSLETYIAILKVSYSVYNLLRRS